MQIFLRICQCGGKIQILLGICQHGGEMTDLTGDLSGWR